MPEIKDRRHHLYVLMNARCSPVYANTIPPYLFNLGARLIRGIVPLHLEAPDPPLPTS